MPKRVTIQDIADELGLSRNTVSKALNNAGGLADATRERIIQTAMDMGYKQFAFLAASQSMRPHEDQAPPVDGPNEISLLTTVFIDRDHFGSLTLDALQNDLIKRGYTFNTHRVTKDDLAQLSLPITLHLDKTAAIICLEMFDRDYDDMVCDLGIPTLFMDGPAKTRGYVLNADQVYMDNRDGIIQLVHNMISRGVTRIGFVGNWEHCQSFLERYEAFRFAMILAGIPVEERFCIKQNKLAAIYSRLAALDDMPELFICANDFVAFEVHRSLKRLGLSVPDDILLSGFDDSSASRHWEPQLTTIHIHTQSMAYSAMHLLITRMQEPNLEFRQVYTQTDLIYRESTDPKIRIERENELI